MRKLVVATSNPGKLPEMQQYLKGLDWQLQLKPPELDVVETELTFAANARLKAITVAKALGEWAIADDSGLVVEALQGAPGIYSARYGKTDSERIARVLRELGEESHRRAQFVCVLAVAAPDGSIIAQSQGVCEGEILNSPRGTQGFGYDPIFYVVQYRQTFAQMSPELKQRVSHRGLAFTQLLSQL
ncbi:RdgB/HAM1 family non-canonical purine NTP pyrophosphatase [Gloeocapsa sp. PCC 73106]|uniref:RdgB/HAM1 family non-canonical purine NTP pyrophosphatase n=1 Tax=Gloeocapsa sp. PCC 73106 TaxID=102232 RepID=UPI0002AC5237|nr:RdgB/HAM1 family non-canonical purine NTP pyrophosphatase [Gloeocapsa sp. PCC 73106]ELR98924.1 non-canonical purine NTP pyrophosphatase, rdgB/HAM1 family [Gloeocapsa sp. PCC 73106]